MRSITAIAALLLAAAFASAPARAYTPESGIWWNPNESGTGVVIEIQDNLMVVAAYVGDTQGRPTWYTATAFLTGNASFLGTLDLTVGSQCMGCPYTGVPSVQPGVGGSLKIDFNGTDNTKARLIWPNGRAVDIERFEFYTRRPEDNANTPTDVTKMLGEWQWITDFSSNTAAAFPYFGDVMVFDQFKQGVVSGSTRWYYEGCRADDSLIAGCSTNALARHYTYGYYDAAQNLQIIVVDDSQANYALYVARVGTNSGEGEVTIYPKNGNPNNFASYPARAFRTASRKYVQEETGPNKAQDTSAEKPGIGDMLTATGGELKLAEAGAVRKFDLEALAPIIAELEAHIEAGAQR